jgi:virulence-associated protein VagC
MSNNNTSITNKEPLKLVIEPLCGKGNDSDLIEKLAKEAFKQFEVCIFFYY